MVTKRRTRAPETTDTPARERGHAGTEARTRAGWRLSPGARKFVLTAHVVFSVGWIGVAASLLTLAVVGVTSDDTEVYRAVGVLGGTFLTPASLGVLITGLALGMGTKWGLVRHYWVAAKLVLSIVLALGANFGLGRSIRDAARRAEQGAELGGIPGELVLTTTVSLTLLLVMTVLSVYKPWGRTRYGKRRLVKA
jgi:hypothetical protein